jgi:hypothetical protein
MTDLDERAALNDWARHLCARFLKRKKRAGRGQANARQALHEEAIGLLIELKTPSAVTALFSVLLGHVSVKSGDLANRHAAELAAAQLEALHDGEPLPVAQVAAEYARVRQRPADNYRREINRLRKEPRYRDMICAIAEDRA